MSREINGMATRRTPSPSLRSVLFELIIRRPQAGLASDIFALLGAGARTVLAAHHAPKAFSEKNVMSLEAVLRGTGDIGATMCAAFGVKQVDATQNLLHVECVKARDFTAPGPFKIMGRPFISERCDFALHKAPGECGTLAEEQPNRNTGGAPPESRQERARPSRRNGARRAHGESRSDGGGTTRAIQKSGHQGRRNGGQKLPKGGFAA